MVHDPKSDSLDLAALDAAIVDLIRREAVKVPPYPAVALKVDGLIRSGDYGLDQLAKLVASDQALAADTLRCANSAFYRRDEPVTALPQAITRVGAKQLASLALASGLGSESARAGPLASLRRSCWQRSLLAAALSRDLAAHRKLRAEEGFSCGLLHDFGELITVACLEEILSKSRSAQARPAEEWQEVVNRYHIELGLVMAARWSLPALISDAISLHHGDDFSGAEDPGLVEVVAASDQIVALASDRPRLSAEDLGAVSLLGTDECQLMASRLERLPSFIASLESGKMGSSDGASLVAPAPRPDWRGPIKPNFKVVVRIGQQELEFEAVGIAHNNVMVSGKAKVPENLLLEMKLTCQPQPLTCWASAKLCWPENGGFSALLQPFALDAAVLARWKELVAQTTPTT